MYNTDVPSGHLLVEPRALAASFLSRKSFPNLSRSAYDKLRGRLVELATGVASGNPEAISEVSELSNSLITGYHDLELLHSLAIPQQSSEWDERHYLMLVSIRSCVRAFWKYRACGDRELDRSALLAAKERLANAGRQPKLARGVGDLIRKHVLRALGPCPDLASLIPSHGPGATATGERGFAKWDFSRMYRQLLPFGGVDLFHVNENHWMRAPYALSLCTHGFTKIVCVPKDVRGPRVISCEPLELMFLQKALCTHLMPVINRNTRGYVKFQSQEDHQGFMLDGGLRFVTLDLKDASDLISRRLVWQCTKGSEWQKLLFAVRSHFAAFDSEGDEVAPLRTFAPMGSAMCFVVLSLVIYGLVKASKPAHPFSIYGDDLIVHVEDFLKVRKALTLAGLKLNLAKTCHVTRFRETCGVDAVFMGPFGDKCHVWNTMPKLHFQCQPAYVKTLAYNREGIYSLIGNLETLYRTGDTEVMFNIVHSMIRYAEMRDTRLVRFLEPGICEALLRYCRDYYKGDDRVRTYTRIEQLRSPRRFNKSLQRLEYRTFLAQPKGEEVGDGYPMLFASLTKRSDRELRFPNAESLKIRVGWCPVVTRG